MLAFSPKTVHYVGRPSLPIVPVAAQSAPGYSFAFVVFLFLNFVLFVRPMELIADEDIYGSEFYLYLILICIVLGFPTVLQQLRLQALEKRPISLCVLGLGLAIVLSLLASFSFTAAFSFGTEYAKVICYFLLFVGLVTTPSRLRHVMNMVLWSTLIVAALTVLQYHDLITLPTVTALHEMGEKKLTGESADVIRLRGTGIFHDPNDLCVLLAFSMLLGLYRLTTSGLKGLRVFWIVPLALLAYAIFLTHSRGGLLAVLAGVCVMLVLRFGRRGGAVLALLVVPAVLIGLAGTRQATLSTSTGTGYQRIEIWSSGLMMLRESPLFGVGFNVYVIRAGLAAHNAYLHVYAETGFLGGTCFFGACFLTLRGFFRLRRPGLTVRDPELNQLLPFLGGACAAYCTGMMTLSLAYLVPTAMIFGIGQAATAMAKTDPELPDERFDVRLLSQLFAAGIVFLAVMYLFVRLSVLRG